MTRKYARNSLEEAFQELHQLRTEVDDLINRKETTLPFRNNDNLPPGVEGQVVIAESSVGDILITDLTRNLTEMGESNNISTSATTLTITPQRSTCREGDGILVFACAPSVPTGSATPGKPISCTDSLGNTYNLVSGSDAKWEAFVPATNDGVRTALFFCSASVAPLVKNVDTITVTWDHTVFDRQVNAWSVFHNGGAATPVVLARTADNDSVTYAADQITLTSPGWTPARDNSMELGICVVTQTAGTGFAFSGVAGWSGFYLASGEFRNWTGTARQTYRYLPTSNGANVLVVILGTDPQYELDIGQLPAGVPYGPFNGFALGFTPGQTTNHWKGAMIVGLQ